MVPDGVAVHITRLKTDDYTTNETLAQHLLIHGRPIPIAEQVAKIEAVDAAQIRRVISRLTATAPTVSAIGPCRTLEPIERIQERLAA